MKKRLLWIILIIATSLGGFAWWFKNYAAAQVQHHEDPGSPEGFAPPPDPDSVE